MGSAGALILQGVRVVDARGVRAEGADVRIVGGRIVSIDAAETGTATGPVGSGGAGYEDRVLQLPGMTVCPGLMNAHAHLCLDGGPDPDRTIREETLAQRTIRSARRLEATLAAGVTTIRDLGGTGALSIEIAAMVERGELTGPRTIAAGQVITMTGGHGHWMGIEADGPDAVRRATRLQIKAGATAIKVMATGGMMTPGRQAGVPQLTVEEMSAAVDEAHKRDLPVGAHAESRVGVLNALRAGVDSVEHGHGGDAEAIDELLARDAFLVPTILSDRRIIEGGVAAGIPAEIVEQCEALEQDLVRFLEPAIRAGVRIAAGNDGGAPLVGMGEMVPELELYVRHGMRPVDALAAATVSTAALFRLADVGLVEPGYHADLLVVDGDPLESIRALADPRLVIRAGQTIGAMPPP
jgi:imidazolonepropionase-like amidohydrolase